MSDWRPISEAVRGKFYWLRRGDHVSLGAFEGGQWCSADGGFPRKAPPTHCVAVPHVKDWIGAQREEARAAALQILREYPDSKEDNPDGRQ